LPKIELLVFNEQDTTILSLSDLVLIGKSDAWTIVQQKTRYVVNSSLFGRAELDLWKNQIFLGLVKHLIKIKIQAELAANIPRSISSEFQVERRPFKR
jgi:hypothetical protein